LRSLFIVFIFFLGIAKDVLASDTLSICYEEWRPYAYYENNIPKGTVLNPIKAKAASMKLQINLLEMPHRRCLELVKKRKVDVALFVDPNDGLNLAPEPIAYWEIAAVTAANRKLASMDDFQNLAGGTFVIARDYDYPQEFLSILKQLNANIVKVPYYLVSKKEEQAFFNYVIKGQGDVMLVDGNWSRILQKEYKLDVNVSEFNVFQIPQYAGFFLLSESKKSALKKLLAK
jgi:hypothetical protein